MINGSAQFILPIIDLTAKSQKQRIEIYFLSAEQTGIVSLQSEKKIMWILSQVGTEFVKINDIIVESRKNVTKKKTKSERLKHIQHTESKWFSARVIYHNILHSLANPCACNARQRTEMICSLQGNIFKLKWHFNGPFQSTRVTTKYILPKQSVGEIRWQKSK